MLSNFDAFTSHLYLLFGEMSVHIYIQYFTVLLDFVLLSSMCLSYFAFGPHLTALSG